jgi:hypothetical protein
LKKRLFHIALSVILSACVKEIPYNPDMKTDPTPAVHCFITPDSILTADCRLTAPFGRKDVPVANAKFSLSKVGHQQDTALYIGNGIHRFSSNTTRANDSLIFKGNVAGIQAFEIPVIIPGHTPIKILDTTRQLIPGIGRAFSVSIWFNDDATKNNYYRCYLYKTAYKYIYDYTGKISDSFLKKEIIALFSDNLAAAENDFNNYTSREVIFSDATFNGVFKNIVFYTSDRLQKTAIERPTGIEFHLENISKPLFDFYNTRNAHIWQQQSISQLPGRITGNIPGGYGVVGAYTGDYSQIALKR